MTRKDIYDQLADHLGRGGLAALPKTPELYEMLTRSIAGTNFDPVVDPEALHPVQQAFIDHGAIQCGFCSPGAILSGKALLDENPNPNDDEIKEALSGVFCRCTGHVKTVDAVREAARRMKEDKS